MSSVSQDYSRILHRRTKDISQHLISDVEDKFNDRLETLEESVRENGKNLYNYSRIKHHMKSVFIYSSILADEASEDLGEDNFYHNMVSEFEQEVMDYMVDGKYPDLSKPKILRIGTLYSDIAEEHELDVSDHNPELWLLRDKEGAEEGLKELLDDINEELEPEETSVWKTS